MDKAIEIVTTNGFRRLVNLDSISSIGELRNNGRSNTVIALKNGEPVFADDTYDNVVELVKSMGVDIL